MNEPKFIIDHNVGKLARWLRMMGYDSIFFDGADDSSMVARALKEDRIILTRDSGIMKRRLITSGKLKAILIESEEPDKQMKQIMERLKLAVNYRPFSLCLECNQPLAARRRDEVAGRLPEYVFKTQENYMECPACRRIYWRGTHWEAMNRKLEILAADAGKIE